MSAASSRPCEDQFLCSICLDVFRDPVTTSCGHNFCKDCITEHWNSNVDFTCPLCKETFPTRPHLKVNTFISAIMAQCRQSSQQNSSSGLSEQGVNPGDVPCDLCTGTKAKALKSCLECLVSYCETHLERHLTVSSLKNHQLIDPVENLESRMCKKHDKPLFFCKTDQTCVCILCTATDHMTHEFAPLEEQYKRKKAELQETGAEVENMIQERQLKVEELKCLVGLSQKKAETTINKGVEVFTALKKTLERSLNDFIEGITETQRRAKKQAEDVIKELDQEISVLMKRSSEMEQLSRCDDQVHVLQTFQSLQSAPPTTSWEKVKVAAPSYEENLARAMGQLVETLCENVKKMCYSELKKLQQYAVNVILDAKTAHPNLSLSGDGKQVSHGCVRKNVNHSPVRFSKSISVLGKQSFSSGKFYFEVQVEEKSEWAVGVVAKSINREEFISSASGRGYWIVWLMNGNEYNARGPHPFRLSLNLQPQKVGVFVDYDQGLVSFYNVDDAALITSFTGCNFTEELYPLFSPGHNDSGKNSTPLIICHVNQNA